MITGFGNNISSALASDITANQTAIRLVPGGGALFAKILTTDISNPSSPHGVYAKLTITDSQQTVFEICHLTAVSNDTLTVIRGQEGTTAKGWALNDVIANFATRGSEESFVQIEQLQAGDYTTATAGGTPNALAISLPSTFGNNNTNDWLLKTPLLVTPIAANSGNATLQVTLGGKVIGTFPLFKGNKAQLDAGDIIPNVPFICLLDSTKAFFTVVNPINLYSKLGTAAFKDVQTSKDDTTNGRVLVNGGTFAIGANQVAVQTGDMSFQFKSDGTFELPGSVKAFNGSTELAQNAVFIRGTGNKHLWFYSPTGDEIGLVYASDDKVLHMRAASGPSLDVDAAGNVTVNGAGTTLRTPNLWVGGVINIGDTDSGFVSNGDGNVGLRANSVQVGSWTSQEFYLGVSATLGGGLKTTSIELQGGPAVIDFHRSDIPNQDYNVRLYNDADNVLTISSASGNPLFNNSGGNFLARGIGTAWGAEYDSDHSAPYKATDVYAAGGDTWCPLITGRGYKGTGFISSTSFGFYIPGGNEFNRPCITKKMDNGATAWWMFNPIDGGISYAYSTPNGVGNFSHSVAMQDWVNQVDTNNRNWTSAGYLYKDSANGAGFNSGNVDKPYIIHTNGTVVQLAREDWVNQYFGTQAWVNQVDANNRAWANGNFVRDIKLGAEVSVPIPYNGRLPDGYVCVASTANQGDPGNIFGCPLQKNVNGTWYTVAKG